MSRLDRYSMLQPDVWQTVQERQRALLRLFVALGWHDLAARRVAEIGCGTGGNLLELLRSGFRPENLTGVELLAERYVHARRVLPAEVSLWLGDARAAPLEAGGFDAVAQFTVFSSLLDDGVQRDLAAAMWRAVKPGGGVLWYDFTVDNPRNAQVRGMPRRAVEALFPEAVERRWQRLTLAPPLARPLAALHPGLYGVANALPWLRTHALGWFRKG